MFREPDLTDSSILSWKQSSESFKPTKNGASVGWLRGKLMAHWPEAVGSCGKWRTRFIGNQMKLTSGKADLRRGAAVECEKVRFDSVAENHSILGHLRNDFQAPVIFDLSKCQLC